MLGSNSEQNTKLVTRLLDDQHSEMYGEREHCLRSPSFHHCVNNFKNSHDSPTAIVGSSSEHEQFCTPRSSFEPLGEQSNCNEGAKTSPTKFFTGSPRSSCADEEVVGSGRCAGTNTPCSELDQVEERCGSAGKAVADDVDDNCDSSSETCIQKKKPNEVRKFWKPAGHDVGLESTPIS